MVELAVDQHGSLRVTLLQGTLRSAEADACVTRAFETSTPALSPGTTVTLSLWMSAS